MKVEQHIYTRARRTLFQQSEGYGTVAKTDGLSEAFIKEKIHPYCVYPANAAGFPKVVTLVHYPCGRMLFGQAVYKEKDFTGQRATFFVHNYIFPPQMVDGALRDFGKLRQLEFLTEYDTELHGPGLRRGRAPARPGACTDVINTTSLLGTRRGTSPTQERDVIRPQVSNFEEILQHIITSVNNTKKTYIISPVPPPQMHDYIWDFLTNLYPRLPEETRHQLGICTYAREPVNKKSLHLIFLEKGTPIGPKFANDFVLDLNSPVKDARGHVPYETTRVSYHSPTLPQQSEFWHIRTPHRHDILLAEGRQWIDKNLEKLTISQLASVPGSFIIRGKGYHRPELYVVLGILKTCAGAISTRSPLDLRYLLGSYSLSPLDHFRVIQNLKRLYQNHITPANYENIVFLFRAGGKGRVDIPGLESYLEKFAPSTECKEAVMLIAT